MRWVLETRWQNALYVERIFGGMLLGRLLRYFLFESKLRRLMLLCWQCSYCVWSFLWKQEETLSSDLSKGNKNFSEALWHIAIHSFNPYNYRWKAHTVFHFLVVFRRFLSDSSSKGEKKFPKNFHILIISEGPCFPFVLWNKMQNNQQLSSWFVGGETWRKKRKDL